MNKLIYVALSGGVDSAAAVSLMDLSVEAEAFGSTIRPGEKAENDPGLLETGRHKGSFLSGNRVVFNIGGNNFRLVVIAVYVQGMLVVDWVGTHAEYDKKRF